LTTVTFGEEGDDTIDVIADLNGPTEYGDASDGTATNIASGGSGDDYVTALAKTDFSGFKSSAVNILDGGEGNDALIATAIGHSNESDSVSNKLSGGAGKDTLTANTYTSTNAGAPVAFNELFGGDDDDILEATHSTNGDGGDSYNKMTSILDGGEGQDTLRASSLIEGVDGGRAVHRLDGGAGHDTLVSNVGSKAGHVEVVLSNHLAGGTGDDQLEANTYGVNSQAGSWSAENHLDGGDGSDTLLSKMSVSTGQEDGPGEITLKSELHGGDGDDFIQSTSDVEVRGQEPHSFVIENHLFGGTGNDSLASSISGGSQKTSSYLYGGSGDDELRVVGGNNNTLDGGEGNDTLTGGAGSDTFVFNLQVEAEQGQTVLFRSGNTPSINASQRAWDKYMDQLDAWRSDLMRFGADLDSSATSSTVSGKKGSAASTYVYDSSYTFSGDTSVTGEGFDFVHGFGNGDTLQLKGLTSSQFLTSFDVSVRDFDSDGTLDTVLSWGESDAGIVLTGVEYHSAEVLLNSGDVLFG
jgi:Ca2+-binding RTX toxin-like protein